MRRLILTAAVLKFASSLLTSYLGNAPKEDNLSMTGWTRLKASPYDERLQLIWLRETSANSRHPWDTARPVLRWRRSKATAN